MFNIKVFCTIDQDVAFKFYKDIFFFKKNSTFLQKYLVLDMYTVTLNGKKYQSLKHGHIDKTYYPGWIHMTDGN